MILSAAVIGAGRVSASLAAAGVLSEQAVNRVVRRGGQRLATAVKGKASGRPGPNAPTGDYRRSIGLEVSRPVAGTTVATVGTNSDQGRRLELGFVGVDSLGRHYDQQPYPHFGPAVSEQEPLFLADVEAEIAKATK